MKIAIVGPEESKWTKEQKEHTKSWIYGILTFQLSLGQVLEAGYPVKIEFDKLKSPKPNNILVSGHCPKGGVDILAEEIADKLGIKKEIYTAEVNQWEDKRIDDCYSPSCPSYKAQCNKILKGYKSRNIQIAEACDVLYCITPKRANSLFNFKDASKCNFCKHCQIFGHAPSGGCWTKKKAESLGKETHLVVID